MRERPDGPREEAERWLVLARDDLLTAETVLAHQERARRNVAFLAQQAAEKALKAVVASYDRQIPRTHQLAAIAAGLPVEAGELDPNDLNRLTPWSEAGRYGTTEDPTGEEATALVDIARRVVSAGEALVAGHPDAPAPVAKDQ